MILALARPFADPPPWWLIAPLFGLAFVVGLFAMAAISACEVARKVWWSVVGRQA